jgi:hypothetical protein
MPRDKHTAIAGGAGNCDRLPRNSMKETHDKSGGLLFFGLMQHAHGLEYLDARVGINIHALVLGTTDISHSEKGVSVKKRWGAVGEGSHVRQRGVDSSAADFDGDGGVETDDGSLEGF